jgi:hypothetical protein
VKRIFVKKMSLLSHYKPWSSMTGEEKQVKTADNKLVDVMSVTQLMQNLGQLGPVGRFSWALLHGQYYHVDEIDDDVFYTDELSVEHEQIVLV